jgi:hypothetical protein
MENWTKMLAFQRSLDRFTGNLLPPRSGFFVAHDEVLVINSRQMEMKLPATYCRFPHQTGVTERSISSHDGSAADNVLYEVVVSHEADRISRSLSIAFDRHDDVRVINESSFGRLCISRLG